MNVYIYICIYQAEYVSWSLNHMNVYRESQDGVPILEQNIYSLSD